MGKPEKRIAQMLEILKQERGVSVKDLASRLDVSEVTVRRDIEKLKKNQQVNFVSGAVMYASSEDKSYQLLEEEVKNYPEKDRIAQKAASLIEEDDVVIFDVGTTAAQVVKYIPEEINITAVCCTVNTLIELRKKKNVQIIFLGGYFHRGTEMFESQEGIRLLERTCATKVFSTAAGVSEMLGVTCVNNYEIGIKTAAIKSALKKILLVDSTKFDRVRSGRFASLDDFDVIITDQGISPRWKEITQELEIEFYTV